jgi:hypothetical protein
MTVRAEWIENCDKHVCLCCGQMLLKPRDNPMTPEKCFVALAVFEGLGLTREELLGKHREQLDYQAPGFAAWLEGQ